MSQREPTVSNPPSLSGRTIDGIYQIEHALGSGAVGAVYAAVDVRTGRKAAVKLWHGTADEQQARARFVREAKALDTLRHPNIVEVYDAGLVDDLPYVAMEFLQGETLEDQLLPGEGMDPKLAFHIMRQVLDALTYAHERHVVHRDLKPENIYLVPGPGGQPQVKLLDYGLAKFLGPEDDPLGGASITVTGMVLGTPLYMPPEQAAGSKVDLRADVYAAGCILFEMLSGRLPYLGDDFGELIRGHLTSPIPNLAEVKPDRWVAPELQTFIDTAMAKSAGDRYDDGGKMLAALNKLPQPAMQPLGKLDRPSALTLPGAPPSQQDNANNLVVGAITAGVVLLVVVLLVTLLR